MFLPKSAAAVPHESGAIDLQGNPLWEFMKLLDFSTAVLDT